jgi:hypothetical protein
VNVVQLRRPLRTLPLDTYVLLEDAESIFTAHDDRFAQPELAVNSAPKR